jgi:hypothetical protein
MMIILPILTFVFIFMTFLKKSTFESVGRAAIKAVLACCLLVFIATEGLSFFSLIYNGSIMLFWAIVLAISVFVFLLRKRGTTEFVCIPKTCIDKDHKFLIYLMFALVVCPLIVIAAYYPPNTADSMAYHLPRIEYWIQNGSISHYPTMIKTQLFCHPFAEYILLHFRLLSGGDFLYNFLQFFCMICSTILVALIAKIFGADYKFQIIAALLALTIPMGLVQSTSTQNDLVAAFFLISFVYFCLDLLLRKNQNRFGTNVAFAAISISLGMLTKLTNATFSAPFCFWFLYLFVQKFKFKIFRAALIAIPIFLSINSPFYVRNYNLTGNILGADELVVEMGNQSMNLWFSASNLIKNIGLHVAIPIQRVNDFMSKIIYKIHNIFGVDPNEPATTFHGIKYNVMFFMDEGRAGNTILMFLILVSIAFFVFCALSKKRNDATVAIYMLCIVVSMFLFSGIFKSQIWHSRLQLPIFVLACPAVAVFLKTIFENRSVFANRFFRYSIYVFFVLFGLSFFPNQKRIFFVLFGAVGFMLFWFVKRFSVKDPVVVKFAVPLVVLSLPYVFFNSIRPILLNKPVVSRTREQNYFTTLWTDVPYQQYKKFQALASDHNLTKIALHDIRFQYPLWPIMKKFVPEVEIRQLVQEQNSQNYSMAIREQNEFACNAILTGSNDLIDKYDQKEILAYERLEWTKQLGNLNVIIFRDPKTLNLVGPVSKT